MKNPLPRKTEDKSAGCISQQGLEGEPPECAYPLPWHVETRFVLRGTFFWSSLHAMYKWEF